jgi:hypothetical protein
MRCMARRRGTIDVGQDEWRVGEDGDVLLAEGIDSCAALALSNPKINRGYLGHFSQDSEVMVEMIRVALHDAASPRDVISWAGGVAPAVDRQPGDPDLASQNLELGAFRHKLTRAILLAGFRHDRTLWLPPRNLLRVQLVSGASRCSLQTDYASS